MPDRIRLDGKVAVVTGAAGVIGTATIRLLAERGACIVAVDRREADLKSAIRDLPASAQPLAVTADASLNGAIYVKLNASVTNSDLLSVGGNLVLNGTLNVTNIAGNHTVTAAGGTNTLVSGSGSDTFSLTGGTNSATTGSGLSKRRSFSGVIVSSPLRARTGGGLPPHRPRRRS